MKRIVCKAACLAVAAALLTFAILYFGEDIDYWRARSDGSLVTRCFQDPLEVVAWKASGWALVAFVGVFFIAMEILVRRENAVDPNGDGHSAQ